MTHSWEKWQTDDRQADNGDFLGTPTGPGSNI